MAKGSKKAPARPQEDEAFENYASDVDELLENAGLPPERDDLVRKMMQDGLKPARAAEIIIEGRSLPEKTDKTPKTTPKVVKSAVKLPKKAAKSPKQARKPPEKAKPEPAEAPPRVRDPGPTVVKLLERPNGASLEEIRASIGWKQPPTGWFIMHWSMKQGRDIRFLKLIEPGRSAADIRWRLLPEAGAT